MVVTRYIFSSLIPNFINEIAQQMHARTILYYLLLIMCPFYTQVLLEELTPEPCPALSKPLHLARAANRLRQRLRPDDPADLDFEIEKDHLPSGVLQADVWTGCPDE